MALIKCKECGKEISDQASTCPNCGAPIEKQVDVPESGSEEVKKKSSKKVPIIIAVVLAVAVVGCGGYYIATMDSRNYKTAQELYKDKKYKDALTLYEKLGDYKDSAQKLKSCKYELSVDGQFMKALTKALHNRWDYNKEGYIKDFGKTEDEMTDVENSEFTKKCVEIELAELQKFSDKKFENTTLGENAKAYLESLNLMLAASENIVNDTDAYLVQSAEAMGKRAALLETFVNDNGLDVGEKYQANLNSVMNYAKEATANLALKTAVDDMVSKVTYEVKDDGWGLISYIVTIENTTEYTFQYFGLYVDVLDENGTIIYTGYSGEINEFAPGTKAQLEVYTGIQGNSLQFHPNYYVN